MGEVFLPERKQLRHASVPLRSCSGSQIPVQVPLETSLLAVSFPLHFHVEDEVAPCSTKCDARHGCGEFATSHLHLD